VNKLVKFLMIFLVISLLALPLVGCADAEPLTLRITTPTDGAAISESPVTLEGTVSDEKATLVVNGRKTFIGKGGYFQKGVTLTEGENTIKVVATRGEETVIKTVTVTYTPSK